MSERPRYYRYRPDRPLTREDRAALLRDFAMGWLERAKRKRNPEIAAGYTDQARQFLDWAEAELARGAGGLR